MRGGHTSRHHQRSQIKPSVSYVLREELFLTSTPQPVHRSHSFLSTLSSCAAAHDMNPVTRIRLFGRSLHPFPGSVGTDNDAKVTHILLTPMSPLRLLSTDSTRSTYPVSCFSQMADSHGAAEDKASVDAGSFQRTARCRDRRSAWTEERIQLALMRLYVGDAQ